MKRANEGDWMRMGPGLKLDAATLSEQDNNARMRAAREAMAARFEQAAAAKKQQDALANAVQLVHDEEPAQVQEEPVLTVVVHPYQQADAIVEDVDDEEDVDEIYVENAGDEDLQEVVEQVMVVLEETANRNANASAAMTREAAVSKIQQFWRFSRENIKSRAVRNVNDAEELDRLFAERLAREEEEEANRRMAFQLQQEEDDEAYAQQLQEERSSSPVTQRPLSSPVSYAELRRQLQQVNSASLGDLLSGEEDDISSEDSASVNNELVFNDEDYIDEQSSDDSDFDLTFVDDQALGASVPAVFSATEPEHQSSVRLVDASEQETKQETNDANVSQDENSQPTLVIVPVPSLDKASADKKQDTRVNLSFLMSILAQPMTHKIATVVFFLGCALLLSAAAVGFLPVVVVGTTLAAVGLFAMMNSKSILPKPEERAQPSTSTSFMGF